MVRFRWHFFSMFRKSRRSFSVIWVVPISQQKRVKMSKNGFSWRPSWIFGGHLEKKFWHNIRIWLQTWWATILPNLVLLTPKPQFNNQAHRLLGLDLEIGILVNTKLRRWMRRGEFRSTHINGWIVNKIKNFSTKWQQWLK